jgi:hypothetical protein
MKTSLGRLKDVILRQHVSLLSLKSMSRALYCGAPRLNTIGRLKIMPFDILMFLIIDDMDRVCECVRELLIS